MVVPPPEADAATGVDFWVSGGAGGGEGCGPTGGGASDD